MFKRLIKSLSGRPAGGDVSTRVLPNPQALATGSSEPITAYDVHGREIQISRSDWRDKMLLPQLQAKWHHPDELYGLIVNALNDEFVAEVEHATRQLVAIDPIVERSYVIRAIVLTKRGALEEAERVLREAVTKIGETGTILTNLAKIQDARGDAQKADATLWKALTLDPNQENGLGWWLAKEHERGGKPAYIAALQRAGALPGSWRAKLILGRDKLAAGEVKAALGMFETVLAQAAQHSDVLLTISGDLGNAGKITELADITGPHYDTAVHSPQVGLNLLQAYLHLGRLDEGEALLSRLYALNMPPFKQHLDTMASKYQEQRGQTAYSRPVDEAGLQIGHVPFELPVWMYGLRDPQWLFKPKPADAQRVTFLMLGKAHSDVARAEEQREDDIGRLSRAIPLYLAESVYEWTSAHAQSVAAVVMGGGPVLFGAQSEAEERESVEKLAGLTGVVVLGSIAEVADAWTVDLGVWDTASLELRGREVVVADKATLETAVLQLEAKILARFGGEQLQPHDRIYRRPTLEQMPVYLNALAQSLVLNLVANGVAPASSMWGERSMLEWPLKMALQWPEYEVPKAMYLSGISHAKRYGSDILSELDAQSFDLLREMVHAKSPLADLSPILLNAFDRAEGLATVRRETKDARRLAWIDRVTTKQEPVAS